VKETNQYHILLIIADGQVDKVQETVQAIVDASRFALSIVCVGVGDGPWDMMEDFDDQIPARRFDNFQFVQLGALEAKHAALGSERLESEFALAALMEVPEQYSTIRRLGLM
jgi:E3 ubiquitin-protein ligase RGLG